MLQTEFERQIEDLENQIKKLNKLVDDMERDKNQAENQIKILAADLERDMNQYAVSQNSYESLRMMVGKGAKLLSDDEAKDILYEKFGFAQEMVIILHSMPIYEINRHWKLRKVGTADRVPLYYASDYYHICFESAGDTYECINGRLNTI